MWRCATASSPASTSSSTRWTPRWAGATSLMAAAPKTSTAAACRSTSSPPRASCSSASRSEWNRCGRAACSRSYSLPSAASARIASRERTWAGRSPARTAEGATGSRWRSEPSQTLLLGAARTLRHLHEQHPQVEEHVVQEPGLLGRQVPARLLLQHRQQIDALLRHPEFRLLALLPGGRVRRFPEMHDGARAQGEHERVEVEGRTLLLVGGRHGSPQIERELLQPVAALDQQDRLAALPRLRDGRLELLHRIHLGTVHRQHQIARPEADTRRGGAAGNLAHRQHLLLHVVPRRARFAHG